MSDQAEIGTTSAQHVHIGSSIELSSRLRTFGLVAALSSEKGGI
jgi:hypothetical protein